VGSNPAVKIGPCSILRVFFTNQPSDHPKHLKKLITQNQANTPNPNTNFSNKETRNCINTLDAVQNCKRQ
jgi:hypothetical protein